MAIAPFTIIYEYPVEWLGHNQHLVALSHVEEKKAMKTGDG